MFLALGTLLTSVSQVVVLFCIPNAASTINVAMNPTDTFAASVLDSPAMTQIAGLALALGASVVCSLCRPVQQSQGRHCNLKIFPAGFVLVVGFGVHT